METLNLFADGLINIPKIIVDALKNATDDQDEIAVINAYTQALERQFTELSQLLKRKFEMATPQEQVEVEQFLKIAGAAELIQAVNPLSLNIGSVIGKIGIKKLIDELKKLVFFLIDLLNLPSWIEKLILLIDQILANILGAGSQTVANMLSQQEQNYLRELTRFAELQRQTNYRSDELDTGE